MTLAPDTFDFVSTLVKRKSAIQLDRGKEYLVESRLMPLARDAGAPSIDAYVRACRLDPRTHAAIIEALTTNETSWFRDRQPFTALTDQVIPVLRDAGRRHLRIWSAACSSGQEPYSIAMTLADTFPGLTASITATDLSEQMVTKARAGRYSQLEVNRGLPAQTLVKHLTRDGATFQVNANLRAMVTVRQHNLMDAPPIGGPYDIVFLRNVLIYFDTDDKRAVLTRIRRAMAPDGFLFLGAAESTLGIDDTWARVPGTTGSLYRPREGQT